MSGKDGKRIDKDFIGKARTILNNIEKTDPIVILTISFLILSFAFAFFDPVYTGFAVNPPVQSTPVLNSTLGTNSTNEDLTCWTSATDIEGDNLNYSGEWYRNGTVFVGEYWNILYDSNSTDHARSIAIDSQDNVILAGNVYIAGNSNDFFTIKYNSNGNHIWNKTYNRAGSNIETAYSVAVDSQDNIIATGNGWISGNGYDYLTIKYNKTDGSQIWKKTYHNVGNDQANSVAVDSQDNVIVSGGSQKVAVAVGGYDSYMIKYYGTNGSVIWNKRYDGSNDHGTGVAVDSQDNIILAITTNVSGDYNYFTIKYDSSGNHIWNITYDGGNDDNPRSIAVDSQDNIIVTGYSNNGANDDYFTIKYNSSGDHIWNRTYNGGGLVDYAESIAVDRQDNVIVTGRHIITPNNDDYFTIKYDSNGSLLWNKTYDSGNRDVGYAVAVDNQNNVIVTGWYSVIACSFCDNITTIKYKDGFVKENQIQGQLVNVGTLENQFTSIGDNWSCNIRSFDGTGYSSYMMSNNLTIKSIPTNTPPTQSTPILSSTSGANYTSENLIVYNQSTSDLDSDPVKNIINWKKNGTSLTVLNMPFEADGDQNATDYSGYGNDGTVSGAVWNKTGGIDGFGAYEFIGDYITVPHSNSINFYSGDKYTIQFWIKSIYTSFKNERVLGKVGTETGYYGGPYYFTTNTAFGFMFQVNNGSHPTQIWTGAGGVNPEEWNHVTATNNGTNISIYLNGELKDSKGISFIGDINNSNDLQIGRVRYGSDYRYFNGTIDELRIYNRALSPEQIKAIYNNRTDLIVSNETQDHDVWQGCITPNDGYQDGAADCSNSLTVLATPSPSPPPPDGGGGGGGGPPEEEEEEEEEEPPEDEIVPEETFITSEGEEEGILTTEQIQEIRSNSRIRYAFEASTEGAAPLQQSDLVINFTNFGDKTLRNLKFVVEQPAVEKEPDILHPRKLFGWDILEITGWISKRTRGNLSLLEWRVSDPEKYGVLLPGESISVDLENIIPLTTSEVLNVEFKILSFGNVIYQETVPVQIDTTQFIVVADVHNESNIVDVYMLISNQHNYEEEYSVEFNINSEQDPEYSPTSSITGLFDSIFNGPQTRISEYYGPYNIQPGDIHLFAYSYEYSDDFADDYYIKYSLFEGTEKVKTASGDLNLKTGQHSTHNIN